MIRDELLLTDEEILDAICSVCPPYDDGTSRRLEQGSVEGEYLDAQRAAIAQAQLDKILRHPRILIRAENQEMPEYDEGLDGLSAREAFNMIQQDMLTPKDGCVWVRCIEDKEKKE